MSTNSLKDVGDLEVDQFKTASVLQSLNLSNLNYELDLQGVDKDKDKENMNSTNEGLSKDVTVEELINEHKKQIERINNN